MSEAAFDAIAAPGGRRAATRATPDKPKPNKKRARVQIDKRYAIGRRIKALVAVFRARVGLVEANPDPVLLTAVEKAARLTALAEEAAGRATRADPRVTLDDVVRLTRLADLSVRRLQLDRKPDAPSLGDLLNGHDPHG
jgi:hypothetical protein